MRRAVGLSAILLLLFAQFGFVSAQPHPARISAEAQLLAAIKLWGDIKFFDPDATDGSVDWDAAFMHAEPAILSASDKRSYGAAIASLLAPLHDPATHVNVESHVVGGRIGVRTVGSVAVVTIPHDAAGDRLEADARNAIAVAMKSRNVLFDIRGVTESDDGDDGALSYLFSDYSSIAHLLKGSIALPRRRSRMYVGYPTQGEGYGGYTAGDASADSDTIVGTSSEPHRFGFLVDGATSLPPLAIALAASGDATIYSTGGQPSILSTQGETISLPYGVEATYRTGDLADVALHQQIASATARGVEDAAANLESQAPQAAHFSGPPSARFADDPYAAALFPTEPMRMLAIARIYNVIRYFSPYRALMHDDWEAAARDAIADERGAGNARAYVLGLMKFYAHLHDSHGFVWNETLKTEFGAGPPFVARCLHAQVVVDRVFGTGASANGLRAGDVIETVNGVPVRRAMNALERYISSSTPQSADFAALRTAGRPSIFTGPAKSTLTLTFHHPGDSRSLNAAFVRIGGLSQKPEHQPPKYFVLPGNVGYVAFDRLEVSEVDAMFDALKNTRAIVFDNRGYPRGAAWPIAPRLTTANSVRAALFDTPLVLAPLDGNEGEVAMLPTFRPFYQRLDPAAGFRYLKPTVMLIDERAISSSEHSSLFFHAANHTRFVGTPTQGANGDVTSMVAPGDVQMYFSGEGVRYPDGRQLQRVGIVPDVRVEPTAADVAAGNDVVLQRGLEEALRMAGIDASSRKAAVKREIARERQ